MQTRNSTIVPPYSEDELQYGMLSIPLTAMCREKRMLLGILGPVVMADLFHAATEAIAKSLGLDGLEILNQFLAQQTLDKGDAPQWEHELAHATRASYGRPKTGPSGFVAVAIDNGEIVEAGSLAELMTKLREKSLPADVKCTDPGCPVCGPQPNPACIPPIGEALAADAGAMPKAEDYQL